MNALEAKALADVVRRIWKGVGLSGAPALEHRGDFGLVVGDRYAITRDDRDGRYLLRLWNEPATKLKLTYLHRAADAYDVAERAVELVVLDRLEATRAREKGANVA